MKKYVATRKDVCAGCLLKEENPSITIFDRNNNEVSEEELAKQGILNFSVSATMLCRGMLFNVDENGLANDLIYTTPTHYPIEGIESKIETESELVIKHYVELEELLKYLKYGIDLTQRDLNQIYRKLIVNNWWLKHHMELFGWKKCNGGYGYSKGIGVETIPHEIYNNLNDISFFKNGNPHEIEPDYGLIRKRK